MPPFDAQSPLLGTPSPFSGYNLLNTGNQQLDMMFTQYAPQILGAFGMQNFLPQQFPAQNLMDQMVSAKYMRTMMATEQQARNAGTEILANRMIQMRGNFDHTPLSNMGAAQFNTIAGAINNRTVMPMLEMMMGAQNVEDVFFGRRGDPLQLQRAVNAVGFYRPDSVTGGSMMSGESLQQFSNQIYSNLYGPDADLNDVSGFSAGRVGSMMTDLARRGLLPQSMSRLGGAGRTRELTAMGFDAATGRFADAALDRSIFGDPSAIKDPTERAAREENIEKVRKAFKNNESLEEIAELEGGADTVRRIDASRVSNSLKGYAEAVGAVRQIFGDNGMGNAPMGQLIAALEALTQNSMSSMSAGKIENLMRRTQMASREGGVSLEALMGLSARTGAMAQQRGLAPEIAAFTNVTAMEYATSMRESGSFTPAFGRMDADKAMLFLAEAGLNAEDSNVGRQLGALERIVQSGGDTYKQSDAAKMLAAVKRGDTSFVNAAGDTVNIAQELGRDSLGFMRSLVTNMGVSTTTFDALTRDTATQEFKIGLEGALGLARQGEEYKNVIGQQTANRGGLGRAAEAALASGAISKEDFEKLSGAFATGFGRDVIDLVDNTQTPEERLETLYQSMRRSFASTTGKTGAAALAEADAKITSIFGAGDAGKKAAQDFLLGEFAAANIDLQQNFGLDFARAQQIYAANVTNSAMARSSVNNMRAGMDIKFGDGSNFLQRFSDAVAGETGGRGFLDAILNTVDSTALENQLMEEVEMVSGGRGKLDAAFKEVGDLYSNITVDTAEEREALVESATGSAAGFAAFVEQASKSFGEEKNKYKGKTLVSQTDLAARLNNADNASAVAAAYAEMKLGPATTSQADMAKALLEHADSAGARTLKSVGLLNETEVTEKDVSDFINNEQIRLYTTDAEAADKARVEAFDRLGQQLDEGTVSGKTIAESFGVTGDKALEVGDAIKAYLEGGGQDVLTKGLGDIDGLTDEQRENIGMVSRFSKQANAMRGLSFTGARGAAGRRIATSRMAAVNSKIGEGIEKDSALARVVADETERGELSQIPEAERTEEQKKRLEELKTRKISPEEKKALDAVMQGDDATFSAAVEEAASKKPGQNKSDVVNAVTADAQKMSGAADAGGGGIIGQITSALSGAMGDVLKDLKVEVTKLPDGFATELGAGIALNLVDAIRTSIFGGGAAAQPVAAAGAKAGGAGTMALTGTVKLEGLDRLVAELTGDTVEDTAPGGQPVTLRGAPAPTTQS